MTAEHEAFCEARIWQSDWAGLLGADPCDPGTWAGSIQASLIASGPAPELWQVAGPMPAFPFCAAIMLIKNEADVIGLNLAWLHRMGVRRFMILDNHSTDTTQQEVERFAGRHDDAEVRLLHDPVVAYLQAVKTTWMCEQARAAWPDLRWLLPIDADEFLMARHGVQSLAYVPESIDAITIQKVTHFYPIGAIAQPGPVRLGRIRLRSHLHVSPPKVILRAAAGLGVAAGNHKVVHAGGAAVTYTGGLAHGFYYREFQTRSFAQFLNKVRQGAAAILAAQALGHDVGGFHWLAWNKTLAERGEMALRSVYAKIAYAQPGSLHVDDPFHGCDADPMGG